MRTKTTTLLLLTLVLAAGACGQERIPQAGAADSKPGGGEPWGRTFLSTSVTEDGRPKALVDGTRITLNFFEDGHRLGAQAGCNQMGGPASFRGGRLVVDDMATTEMGCDPPRHAQDEWLARFLTSKPVITTKMACDDDRMRVERAVLATLDGDVRYQIDADVLRLDGPGGHGLRLRATP